MNLSVELTSRESVPNWLAYSAPLLTVLAALVVTAVPLLLIDVNPLDAYVELFIGTLSGLGGISDVLRTALPLFLAGLAVYIPLKAGLWNIGAEGQIFVGAIVGAYIGLNFDWPSYALIPLMVVAGGIVASIFGAIPGYLRAEHNVNEIISSLMLTFSATTFTGYLLRGPMQGRGGQTATDRLPEGARIPSEFPLVGEIHPRLHAGVVLLLVAVVAASVLMSRTKLGYEITFIGANPEAATQAGISKYKIYVLVFVFAGLLAGVAGAIEISGVHGRLFEDFSPGYGFTAIAVALLGRNGPFRVLLAALFFGLLTAGGTSLAVSFEVPSALIDIVVALVILFLLTAEFVKEYRIDVELGRESKPETGPETEGSV